MREFKFNYIDAFALWYVRLKFRKIKNKDLYYMIFKERSHLSSGEIFLLEFFGIILLGKFLKFNSETEVLWHLKTQFQYEMNNNRICFPESEIDKVISWIESVDIMNKLVE